MRKIILGILALGILGTGWYYFLSGQTSSKPLPKNDNILEVKAWGINNLVNPVASLGEDAIWYATPEGKMMRLSLTAETPTEYPVPNILGNSIKRVFWPKEGNDFIAIGSVDEKNTFNYFSNTDNSYRILPANTLNLDWLSDSKRILIIWRSGNGKTQLVTSNADGSGYKVINEVPWDDLIPKVSPISNSTALMYRADLSGETNKIYSLNLESGQYKELIVEGRNTGVLWSPDGQKFVFTRLVSNQRKVFLYDLKTSSITPVEVTASIGQVAFSKDGKNIYSVDNLEDGQEIVQINPVSGKTVTYFRIPQDKTRIKSIFLVGQTVYYIGEDDYLYSIE
jgi:hypothetical protein